MLEYFREEVKVEIARTLPPQGTFASLGCGGDRANLNAPGGRGVSATGPVNESTIPSGFAEAIEGCWCCAPAGETCTPENKTGLSRALLVECFDRPAAGQGAGSTMSWVTRPTPPGPGSTRRSA